MPTTTVTIDGTSYNASQRAAIGLHLNEMVPFALYGGHESFTFSEVGAVALPRFARGKVVSVSIDGTTYFVGKIVDIQWQFDETGWTIGYSCFGLRYVCDRLVPVTATDGTGSAYYNRSPDDQDYVSSDAGLSVGTIFQRILTVSTTATALNALGVGQYTTLTPPTLPSTTLTDLGNLTVVPPTTVVLSGQNLFNQMEALLARYHPKYALHIQPDGLIRFRNVKGFTGRTLTLGTDPVQMPNVRSTIEDCYSRIVIRGGSDVEPYVASTLDGTAVAAWSGTDQTNWKLTDFTAPGDAISAGTVSSLTSTGCNVTSSSSTQTWASNFWSGRQAWIQLYNDSGTGIAVSETRPISANGALTAGGSASVSWSSSWPLDNSGYTRYRIIGTAGTKNDVGRLFYLRQISGNLTGVNSWVGSHLVKRFPLPFAWANNTKVSVVYGASGVIVWSSTGSPSYLEIPATLEVVPTLGAVRFTEPVVLPFGNRANLTSTGWPSTNADGLPVDVKFVVPYSRGALTAVKPASGYEGTLYTGDSIGETAYYDMDGWIYKGDKAAMETLAQEHLDSIKDVVFEGSITHLGIPSSWDSLLPGNKLNIALASGTSPWSSMDAPITSVTLHWDSLGRTGVKHIVTLQFSSRQRPFSADDLYTHPAFGRGVFGADNFDQANAAMAYGFNAPSMNGDVSGGWINPAGGFGSETAGRQNQYDGIIDPGSGRTDPGFGWRMP